LIVSVLYRLAVNYLGLHARLSLNAAAVSWIDTIITLLGIMAFLVFVIAYMLYRRRRLDGSLDQS